MNIRKSTRNHIIAYLHELEDILVRKVIMAESPDECNDCQQEYAKLFYNEDDHDDTVIIEGPRYLVIAISFKAEGFSLNSIAIPWGDEEKAWEEVCTSIPQHYDATYDKPNGLFFYERRYEAKQLTSSEVLSEIIADYTATLEQTLKTTEHIQFARF